MCVWYACVCDALACKLASCKTICLFNKFSLSFSFWTVLVMTRAPVSMESFNPSKSSNSESDIGEPGAPVTALGDGEWVHLSANKIGIA